MRDLVSTRQHLRTPSVKANQNRCRAPHRQLGSEVLFGCEIARAGHLCDSIAIALSLLVLDVKSVQARGDVAQDIEDFRKWYSRRMNNLLQLDVSLP